MKVLGIGEGRAQIEFNLDELQLIHSAIAVALSELEESHFTTRVGYSKDIAQSLLIKLDQAIDEIP